MPPLIRFMVGEAKNSIEIIASLASAGVEAKADQK
jgi:hypothetical protein